MPSYNNPTYAAVLNLMFGNEEDRAGADDEPRVRVLSGGRLEISGIVFGRRDGRESPYRSPWSDAASGESE